MKAFFYIKNTDNPEVFSDIVDVCKSKNYNIQLVCENKRSFRELDRIKNECQADDLVVICSLSSLGLNEAAVQKQLEWFIEHWKLLAIVDMPSTFEYEFAQPLNQAVLKTILQNLSQESNNVISMPKRHNSGRSRILFPDNWDELYALWERKEITSKKFQEELGIKRATFYNLLTEYKKLQELQENYIAKYTIS